MAILVQKYGGTSVGSVERIQAVAEKIITAKKSGDDVVVVVSAMSGETNRLLALAHTITKDPSRRELDVLLSTGEQVSIALLTMALEAKGCTAVSCTGGQVIRTDNTHNKARILDIEVARIEQSLQQDKVVVVAGFQGIDTEGNITTLGRGGSDTTAVALAAALKARECHIYTDVDGVYTADPRLVPTARRLPRVSYDEMLELASLGSKVLQIRSVEFGRKYEIDIRVLSTFNNQSEGTLITTEDKNMEQVLIAGIAHNKNEAKLTLVGIPDEPGIAFQILGPIAEANIEVDMIVQNIGVDNTTDFTFTVNRTEFSKAFEILRDIGNTLNAKDVLGDDTIVKVSIVGIGMRSHAGIASKMFSVLSEAGINIQMISTSEIKISVVISEEHLAQSVQVLHAAFALDKGVMREEDLSQSA